MYAAAFFSELFVADSRVLDCGADCPNCGIIVAAKTTANSAVRNAQIAVESTVSLTEYSWSGRCQSNSHQSHCFGFSVPIAQRAFLGANVTPFPPVATRPATSVLPEPESVPFDCNAMVNG